MTNVNSDSLEISESNSESISDSDSTSSDEDNNSNERILNYRILDAYFNNIDAIPLIFRYRKKYNSYINCIRIE